MGRVQRSIRRMKECFIPGRTAACLTKEGRGRRGRTEEKGWRREKVERKSEEGGRREDGGYGGGGSGKTKCYRISVNT